MTVVAVLGAGGSMGSGMARNLARAGIGVRAWNRTREKAEPLAGDGVAVLGSPAQAAEGADVMGSGSSMPRCSALSSRPRRGSWSCWPPVRTSSGIVCSPSLTRWASARCGSARPAGDRS